jgi:large subunit ribosomal protein L25
MTDIIKFSAEPKSSAGTGSSRAARRDNRVPAVVYGGNAAPEMVSLLRNEFIKEYQKGSINTKLIELDVAGRKFTVLSKEVQMDPVSDMPIHVDFLRVDKDTKIKVSVALRVINEEKSPGIKRGGVMNIVNRHIDFMCSPFNIPHHIEIDIAELEIGQNIHISDVKLSEGVEPVDSSNFTVLSIAGRTEESEAAPAAADATAAPATEEKK